MDNQSIQILKDVLMHFTMANYQSSRQFTFDIILNQQNEKVRKELTQQICTFLEKVLTDKKPNPDLQMSIIMVVKDLMIKHPKFIANSLLASKAPDAMVDLIFRQTAAQREVSKLCIECLYKWSEAFPMDKKKKPTNFSNLVAEMKDNGINKPTTFNYFGKQATASNKTPVAASNPTPDRKELKIKPGQQLQPQVKGSLNELSKLVQKIKVKLESLQENDDMLKELQSERREIGNSKKEITILQSKTLQTDIQILSETLTEFLMQALIFCEKFEKLCSDHQQNIISQMEACRSMYEESESFLNMAKNCKDLKGNLSLQSSIQPSQFDTFTPGAPMPEPQMAQPYKPSLSQRKSYKEPVKEEKNFMGNWNDEPFGNVEEKPKVTPGGPEDDFFGDFGGAKNFQPFKFDQFEKKPASFSQVFGQKDHFSQFEPNDQDGFEYKPTIKAENTFNNKKEEPSFNPPPVDRPAFGENNAYDALKTELSKSLIQPTKTFKKASELLYDETFNGSVSKYSMRDFSEGIKVTKTKYSGRTIAFDDSFYQEFERVQTDFKGQTLRKFKTANLKEKGVLYQTEQLQIGFKSSKGEILDKQFIRVDLFVGNKTDSPISNLKFQLTKQPQILIYSSLQKQMPDIPAGRQGIVSFVFFIQESKMVNMRLTFKMGGSLKEARFFLPCLIIKKIEFEKVPVEDFRREWRAMKSTMIRTPIFNMSKIIGNLSSLKKYTSSFTEMTALQSFLEGKQELKLCTIAKLELDRALVKLRCRANHTAIVQLVGRCNPLAAQQIVHNLQFILGAEQ